MLSSRYSKYQVGNPVCEAGLVIHKDGKTTNSGHTCQKFCCPFRQSKTGCYPCNHKSWNNGRKNRGCMKYKTILSDYRFSIDRDAYNLSASMPCMLSVKRYKSRFKVFGQERLWVRNGTSSAKLNSFSYLSTGDCPGYCALRISLLPFGQAAPSNLPHPYLFSGAVHFRAWTLVPFGHSTEFLAQTSYPNDYFIPPCFAHPYFIHKLTEKHLN